MTDNARIGARIKQARKRLNLNQGEFSALAGITHPQTVSQIEHGQREVKAAELVRIARALHVSLTDLLLDDAGHQPAYVLWREGPAEDAGTKEAKFLERWTRFTRARAAIRRNVEHRLPEEVVDFESLQFPETGTIATRLGGLLNLGSRPAVSLADVLESRFDVLVWYEDLGREGSAACMRDEQGCAVLINASEAPWRRNFDLAHELFHLVTWQSASPELLESQVGLREKMERHANVFASHLLLPADSLLDALDAKCVDSTISWPDLIGLAREFSVSTDALIWRLVNLRRLEREQGESLTKDPTFKTLDRSARRGSWSSPPPLPENYVVTAFLAYTEGKMSRALLAEYLDTSLVDLAARLAEYGLPEGDYYSNEVHTC